jgi:hypothetical protein
MDTLICEVPEDKHERVTTLVPMSKRNSCDLRRLLDSKTAIIIHRLTHDVSELLYIVYLNSDTGLDDMATL